MSSEMFYPSGDDVDRMIELAIQCGIDNRGTSWPLELCRVRAKLRALLARTEAGAVEKRAPVQRYHGKTIPWRVHGLAWEAYAKKYGSSQSAERIAERGGFGVGEMDEFLPGWREMAEGTHPQDASGDAESTALYLRPYDVTMIGQAKHAGQDMVSVLAHLHPTEGWDVRFNVAMQAKEAK